MKIFAETLTTAMNSFSSFRSSSAESFAFKVSRRLKLASRIIFHCPLKSNLNLIKKSDIDRFSVLVSLGDVRKEKRKRKREEEKFFPSSTHLKAAEDDEGFNKIKFRVNNFAFCWRERGSGGRSIFHYVNILC